MNNKEIWGNEKEIYESAYNNYKKGNINESFELFEKLNKIHPWPSVYNFMGLISYELINNNDAEKYFRYALTLQPDNDNFLNNLGLSLVANGNLERAVECYKRAIELNPGEADYYNNLGTAYAESGQYEKAFEEYNKTLEIEPGKKETIRNIAFIYLMEGNFQKGWELYEIARENLPAKVVLKNIHKKPEWDGSDLNGKTIYVCWEQGLGDTIQFIRYLPILAHKGGRIVLNCKPELKKLFTNLDFIHEISTIPVDQLHEEKIPFDTFIMLMTLPRIFKISINNIPVNMPYIFPEVNLKEFWNKKLRNYKTFKAGFVWHNRFPHRSFTKRYFPVEYFYKLAEDFPEAMFFNLQVGNCNITPKMSPPHNVLDLSEEIHDFSDTAAIIDNLDLVISVDTSTAHLAGAIGKQVWNLLPFSADWRWLLNRNDSPWYPTMKLFRQKKTGDWESVFENIRYELLKIMEA